MLKVISFSLSSQRKGILSPLLTTIRHYSNKSNDIENIEKPKSLYEIKTSNVPIVKVWHEGAAVRRNKKNNRGLRKVDNIVDALRLVQSSRNIPTSFSEWALFFKKRRERKQLLEQQYLPERVAILKPDLAAAHFLLRRGGSVKFLGKVEWTGRKGPHKTLPNTYVPGYIIEAIDAEGTGLYYEGLENLKSLNYLKSLSLKGLKEINDWCLDWISKEYHTHLELLDITDCKAVTYRGLSCFYRFECLKTLNLTGVPETPELKVACLMLLDIMPDLDIQGIDLSIPDKLDPVNLEEMKNISSK